MIQRKFLVSTLLLSLVITSIVNIGTTNAASNNLVVIHTLNPFTSLNPYTTDSNLTINRDVN